LHAIRASITGRGKTLGRVALAVAIVVLATFVVDREFHSSATKVPPSLIPQESIAVLPFENLSVDPDNAYFAEGIQEEILTRLAKVVGLKVISRTSTQRYQSKPGNLGEIAKQLGVANILEGSVQKVSDQVRVNVQLINAQTDSHLWAESYDRNFADILSVESEIAKRVANSLQAKLTGREENALAVKPTNNPEAYDAYLHGLALDARSGITSYSTVPAQLKAANFYERAVQFDPNFAIAWARLSRVNSVTYPMFSDTTAVAHAARRDAAKRALENAQKLEPNSPETLLALGYYQFCVLRDNGLAKTAFGRVGQMVPGSSEVPYALGQVARGEGNWDQCIRYFEQALALDPRNIEFLFHVAWTYGTLRQFPAALKLFDRALDITPNDPDLMAFAACIHQGQGNLQEAAHLLVEVNAQTKSHFAFRTKVTQLKLERNYDEALRLLQARLNQLHFDSQDDTAWEQVALALIHRLTGDTTAAKIAAEQARSTLEQLFRDQQSNAWLPYWKAWLSQAYAVMGEKDSALEEAKRAILLVPRDQGRMDGPALKENLALIQTMFDEKSRVISTLMQLLQTPYNGELYNPTPITPALLRLDPLWDPLRSDPAFQKLCEEKQPVTLK
jgi:TolB-like protein/Tfp pilus assembly protein PilF